MPTYILIGLGAGLAAAIMLFSAAQGPSITGFLLSLTSMLPIFLAGLGWGFNAAAIASLTGALIFAAIASPAAGGVWFLSQALPVLLLCYYAGLSRVVGPSGSGSPGSLGSATAAAGSSKTKAARATSSSAPAASTSASASNKPLLEWYPVGHLLAITGVIGGILASILLSLMGTTVAQLHAKIKTVMTGIIEKFPALAPQKISPEQMDKIVDVLVIAWPASFGIACVLILLFNFWLAARITRSSGRLARPWPDLAAIKVPTIAALGLSLSLMATYLSGMPGLYATAFAGAFMVVYVCVGLAVIHYITRSNPYRGFILWLTYFLLLFFNTYAMLAVALIGITEPISPFKRRFPSGPPPSGPPPAT